MVSEYNMSYLSLFLHFHPIFMAKQLISVGLLAFLKESLFELFCHGRAEQRLTHIGAGVKHKYCSLFLMQI